MQLNFNEETQDYDRSHYAAIPCLNLSHTDATPQLKYELDDQMCADLQGKPIELQGATSWSPNQLLGAKCSNYNLIIDCA